MKTYKYSILFRFVYRYSNIPITLLLLIYLASSIAGMFLYWYYFFFVSINVFVIYSLNKFFIKSYKIFPFEISADGEGIICSDFFLSSKKIKINFGDIDKISGGVFSGYPARPTYIYDSKRSITIGIYAMSGNFPELLKTILQNIKEDLYNDLILKMKEMKK